MPLTETARKPFRAEVKEIDYADHWMMMAAMMMMMMMRRAIVSDM